MLLAAGGFPHDVAAPPCAVPPHPHRRGALTLAPPETTGDGHDSSASRRAGGSTPALASPAAWCPVSLVPYRNGRTAYPHIVDRGKPGLIAVLSTGRRFVNEADGYHQFTSPP